MTKVNFTVEALTALTFEQKAALLVIATSNVKVVDVQKGGLDLPDGYLGFRIDYEQGSSIYGGIAPAGDVST